MINRRQEHETQQKPPRPGLLQPRAGGVLLSDQAGILIFSETWCWDVGGSLLFLRSRWSAMVTPPTGCFCLSGEPSKVKFTLSFLFFTPANRSRGWRRLKMKPDFLGREPNMHPAFSWTLQSEVFWADGEDDLYRSWHAGSLQYSTTPVRVN